MTDIAFVQSLATDFRESKTEAPKTTGSWKGKTVKFGGESLFALLGAIVVVGLVAAKALIR